MNVDDLFGDDPRARLKAAVELARTAGDDPAAAEPHLPALLGVLQSVPDPQLAPIVVGAASWVLTRVPGSATRAAGALEAALAALVERADEDDAWGQALLSLVATLHGPLMTDGALAERLLPSLVSLALGDGDEAAMARGVVATASIQRPAVLAPFVSEVLTLVIAGRSELVGTLAGLYPHAREAFEADIDRVAAFALGEPHGAGAALLLAIAKRRSDLIAPHIEALVARLDDSIGGAAFASVVAELAAEQPESVLPHLDAILAAVRGSGPSGQRIILADALGRIGRRGGAIADVVVPALVALLEHAGEDHERAATLMHLRNACEPEPERLAPHAERIRALAEDPVMHVREAAKAVLALLEGGGDEAIERRLAEVEARIAQAEDAVSELRRYVDDNLEAMNAMLATLGQRLPIPASFSSEGLVRRTIVLHFVCAGAEGACLFPEDRPFRTESKTWNRWLKIALSACLVGRSVLAPTIVEDAIDGVKGMYDAYRERDGDDFATYVREPFLTSAEQDRLIEQLRAARFFDVFGFDARAKGWVCTLCRTAE